MHAPPAPCLGFLCLSLLTLLPPGVMTRAGSKAYITTKALNEFDPAISGVNWRLKLESQRAAVLANELKNNRNKLARSVSLAPSLSCSPHSRALSLSRPRALALTCSLACVPTLSRGASKRERASSSRLLESLLARDRIRLEHLDANSHKAAGALFRTGGHARRCWRAPTTSRWATCRACMPRTTSSTSCSATSTTALKISPSRSTSRSPASPRAPLVSRLPARPSSRLPARPSSRFPARPSSRLHSRLPSRLPSRLCLSQPLPSFSPPPCLAPLRHPALRPPLPFFSPSWSLSHL